MWQIVFLRPFRMQFADDTDIFTINLDYRSLYHHFECATYLYGVDCIADIEADYQSVLKQCRAVTTETIRHEKWTVKVSGIVLKAIAPLM